MTTNEIPLGRSVVRGGVLRTGAGLIAAGALLSTVGFAVCCSAALERLRRYIQPDGPVPLSPSGYRTRGSNRTY